MAESTVALTYPDAVRLDVVDEIHGQSVADPYRWLEDPDDARTVAWSEAQDDLYASARATWTTEPVLRARLAELHAVGDVGVPVWRGRWSFTLRRSPEQEHAVVIVTDGETGAERTLIDPMEIDPAGTTTLDFFVPSPDGRRLAYGLSEGGSEQAVLRVMDTASREIVDTPIDRVRYTPIAWLPDGDGFYYVRSLPDGSVPDDDAQLHRRVYLHTIGGGDRLIFGEGAARATYFDVGLSEDGRWLSVSASRGTDPRNDLWLADLRSGGDLVVIQQDVDAHAYVGVGRDGVAYIYTNRDAPRWRLCVANPRDLVAGVGYGGWRTLLPEDPTAVLNNCALLDGADLPARLIIADRTRHAVSELTVHDATTGTPIHDLPLPGRGTVGSIMTRHGGGHEAWFSYTDFTTPDRILRYDATTATVDVWAKPPGEVATVVEFVTRQVTYPSYDGTEIHMFVVSAAGRTQPAPTILYGYGGFNIAMAPDYGPSILAWVEAGGVYAIAGLRGGSEEGEDWHRAGMRGAKQNVFDDLHAAADWLVREGITTYARLGIFGGSNGGLLVGAAVTQHPEKYAAVVCSAPLLDMLRYEHFGLGANWTGEYGSVAIAEEFGWLRAYSPYHTVIEGSAYPAIVITVFDGDTRVDPLHGRKLCAALQHATSGSAPILIRRERSVGHAGRAVSKTVDLSAERLAFFAAALE